MAIIMLPNLSSSPVVSSYKELCNNKPMYGYMLPNLSSSPNIYKVQSVYNNNVVRDPYMGIHVLRYTIIVREFKDCITLEQHTQLL